MAALTSQKAQRRRSEKHAVVPRGFCGSGLLNLERIWRVVLIVESLFFGQHALMKDTGNQNAAEFFPEKHNMLALLHAPQAKANFITRAAERGIIGKEVATIVSVTQSTMRLSIDLPKS